MKDFHLRQIQHLQKELDAVQTFKNYNIYRRRVLQQQKYNDYKNEYERILGELSKTKTPATVKRELRKRADALKQMQEDHLSANIFPK